MHYNCVLVEDEPYGIELMQNYIGARKEMKLLRVIREYRTLVELVSLPVQIDVIFIDLKIIGGMTVGMIDRLMQRKDTLVVIVSGIPERTYREWLAFPAKINLRKPVSPASFMDCADLIARLKKK